MDIRLDEYGRMLPSECYFPNGFETLIARTHELGLKFGLHIMRGVPRKAVENKLFIKADDIESIDCSLFAWEF